jgi:uncharacterized MAPEG superfamily protein
MVTDVSQLYAIPAFRLYAIVTLLLVVKMMIVGFYTAILRGRKKVFATPEDYETFGAMPRAADDDIERARRAHLNDLESILPFLFVALLFALTAPSIWIARLYFWGFFIARVFHSIAYIGRRQPHRTVAFAIGVTLTLVMLVHTLLIVL